MVISGEMAVNLNREKVTFQNDLFKTSISKFYIVQRIYEVSMRFVLSKFNFRFTRLFADRNIVEL